MANKKNKRLSKKVIYFGISAIGLLLLVLIFLATQKNLTLSGRIADADPTGLYDIRALVFDSETGGKLLDTIDFNDIQVNQNGTFEIDVKKSVFSLPGSTYYQLCVNTDFDLSRDGYTGDRDAIPVCKNTGDEKSQVHEHVGCTRRRAFYSYPGLFEELFDIGENKIYFNDLCDQVYNQSDFVAVKDKALQTKVEQTFIDLSKPDKLDLNNGVLSIVGSNNVDISIIDTDTTSFNVSDGLTVNTVEEGETVQFKAGSALKVLLTNPNMIKYSVAPSGIGVTQISSSIAGLGLSGGSGSALNVNVDGSTIVVSGDTLFVPTGGITSVQIATGAVTTTEILDGTIVFADIADTGCAAGEVFEWSGAAWVCGTDSTNFDITDTVTTETITEGNTITFAGGTGLTASVTAVDTVTYGITAGGVGVTEISSAIAGNGLSGGSGSDLDVNVDGSTIVIAADILSVPTGGITTTEILDGTILFSDIGDLGCAVGETFKWGGAAWICGTDLDDQNLFLTIDAPGGTDPVADSDTDVLTFSNGAGILITGDSTTDTISIAAVLGSTIESIEITDGTITADDLGTDSVGADEIATGAVTTTEILNGTVAFVDFADAGCAAGEVIEWSGVAWTCGIDNTGGGSANSFETMSTPSGTSPVADSATDTLTWLAGSGITISGDATTDTITVTNTLGSSIESSEITNGTIVFADLADTGCSAGEVIEWSGAAWVCGTDNDTQQNLFETISTTSGSSPVADSMTDTLSLVAGSGVTVTGDSVTDSVTFAAVLGSTIESFEITDGTITADDLGTDSVGSDEIATGAVTTSEILNGTILFADIAQNGCSVGEIMQWSGAAWVCDADDTGGTADIFETISTPNGTSPVADNTNDTLTLLDGDGITITGDASTDSITITNDLGSSIESSEITNGTIVFADLADTGCAAGEIIEWSGAAWVCGTDNTGGGSTNSFETMSTPSGTSPVADSATDTLSWVEGAGITITGDSGTDSITIASVLGATIESSEITNGTITSDDLGTDSVDSDEIATGAVTTTEILDGTILFADIGSNGCGAGAVIEWSGAAWTCGTDDDNQSLFETISTTSGTSPVADSATDVLTLAAGSGMTVTGDAGTDTVTFAAVLGSTIESAEITDGTITFADIAQNGCSAGEIMQWSGAAWVCDADDTGGTADIFETISTPNGTSPVADNTNDTLTLLDGTGITITGDASTDSVTIASTLGSSIESGEITNGTILFADLNQNGCSLGENIEWGGSAWICGVDSDNQNLFETISTPGGTSPVADSATDVLNLAEGSGVIITGTAATDTVTIAAVLGATIDTTEIINGTILFADIGSNGCGAGAVMKWSGAAWTCGTDLDSQNLFETVTTTSGTSPVADNPTDTLAFIAGSGVIVTGSAAADSVTFASTLGTTIETSEITNGTILLEDLGANGCTSGQVMEYNGSAWICNDASSAAGTKMVYKTADESETGTTFQQDDHLNFNVAANETWSFNAILQVNAPGNGDIKFRVDGPTTPLSCSYGLGVYRSNVNTTSNVSCGVSSGQINTAGAAEILELSGGVRNAGNAGSINFYWAKNSAQGGAAIIYRDSYIIGVRQTGADLAEIYYTKDNNVRLGTIVTSDNENEAGVIASTKPYQTVNGVISSKPGQVLANHEDWVDGGRPVPVALSGRVPIAVNTESGKIKAGDMIAASSTPGEGMKATKSGYVVGRALTDYIDEGDQGYVVVFVNPGYWQAPVNFDLDSVLGSKAVEYKEIGDIVDDLSSDQLATLADNSKTFTSFDQDIVDEIIRGFSVHQGEISKLKSSIDDLELTLNELKKANSGALDEIYENGFIDEVSFNAVAYFNASVIFSGNAAGQITVGAGDLTAEVSFNPPHPLIPKVVATPRDFVDGSYRITNITPTGFTIELNKAQLSDKTFEWQAVVTSSNP